MRTTLKQLLVLGTLAACLALAPTFGTSPAGAASPIGSIPISGGTTATCAVTTAGGVQCWGDNSWGQLGDGRTVGSIRPVEVQGATDVKAVAVGGRHACSLSTGGAVRCWGADFDGQLGNGNAGASTVPVGVTGLGVGVVAIAAGEASTCATLATGQVRCWGANDDGQLGDGTLIGRAAPVAVTGLTDVVALDLGENGACAITGTPGAGTVRCWGNNDAGQLGDGTTTRRTTPVAVVGLGGTAKAITAGMLHSCAVLTSGDVRCWGGDGHGGHLGRGSTAGSLVPVPTIPNLGGIEGITAGAEHTCAWAVGSTTWCWGAGSSGQIGNNGFDDQLTPFAASNDTAFVTTGYDHTCQLRSAGDVRCWGNNSVGGLGTATPRGNDDPQDVAHARDLTPLSVGGAHACALRPGGSIRCWGNGGALGHGSSTSSSVPVDVVGITGATAVGSGIEHNCAATAAGVSCWGANYAGQLGNGSTTSTTAPVAVSGIAGRPLSVAAGSAHSCAVITTGQVRCWGQGTSGQLGNSASVSSTTPVTVTGITSALAVVAGGQSTCALLIGGAVRCWGEGSRGELGDGSQEDHNQPGALLVLDSGVTSLAMGLGTGCAVKAGTAYCWGRNTSGQVGNATTDDQDRPRAVVGLPSGPVSVAVGQSHACALAAYNEPFCWGANDNGQLGDSGPGRSTAAYVEGQGRPLSIAAGVASTCTLDTSGAVRCWGANSVGQLGNGTTVSSASPVVAGTAGSFYRRPFVTLDPGSAPFASWGALVDRVFLDLTGKAPTTGERATWVAQLSGGTKHRGDLVQALRTGADGTGNVDPATRLYRAFLQRTPDAGGLGFWVGRRRSGAWNLNRTADFFASSTEFKTKYGNLTNRAFVTLIYTDVLGRAADPSGVDFWTGRLDNGRASRGSVMVGFSESNEYRNKTRSLVDVAVAYVFLAGRSPRTAEVAGWTTAQAAGTTTTELSRRLLESPAYAAAVGD